MAKDSGILALLVLGVLAALTMKKNGAPGYYVPYGNGGWVGDPIVPAASNGATVTPEEAEESRILTRRTRRVTRRVRETVVIPMTKYRPGSEDLIIDPGVQSPIPGNVQAMLAYGIEA